MSDDKPTLTTAQVERLIAIMADLEDKFLPKLIARLKNLLRRDLPITVETRRGRETRFDADSFWISVIAMELNRVYLTPNEIVLMLDEAWPDLRKDISSICDAYLEQQYGDKTVDLPQVIWAYPLDAFSEMKNKSVPYYVAPEFVKLNPENKKFPKFEWSRLLINITDIVFEYIFLIKQKNFILQTHEFENFFVTLKEDWEPKVRPNFLDNNLEISSD